MITKQKQARNGTRIAALVATLALSFGVITANAALAAVSNYSITSCQFTALNGSAITPTSTLTLPAGAAGTQWTVTLSFGQPATSVYFGAYGHYVVNDPVDPQSATITVDPVPYYMTGGGYYRAEGSYTYSWYAVDSVDVNNLTGSPLCTITVPAAGGGTGGGGNGGPDKTSNKNFGHSDKSALAGDRSREAVSGFDPSGSKK